MGIIRMSDKNDLDGIRMVSGSFSNEGPSRQKARPIVMDEAAREVSAQIHMSLLEKACDIFSPVLTHINPKYRGENPRLRWDNVLAATIDHNADYRNSVPIKHVKKVLVSPMVLRLRRSDFESPSYR